MVVCDRHLDNGTISSYCLGMRRRMGVLVPLEVAILEASAELSQEGQAEVHGYALATVVRDIRHAKRLTAYGTLYKALARLERDGLLASRWEDPTVAAGEARPRRRFYRLTLDGAAALKDALAADREPSNYRPAAAAVQ